MNSLKLTTTVMVLTSAFVIACAPKNPRLVSPSAAPEQVVDLANVNNKVDVNPKVDILFVMDTSESMAKHQENVKANVGRFVEAFEANKNLDFHIGVVSIFDSVRFGSVVPQGKFYPLGLLRPLKDPAHPGQAVPGPQYITRTANYVDVLGATLQVGIEPRCSEQTDSVGRKVCVDANGPEYEDSFSPVMAALGGQNAGFYRPDAHLAVIMITDADSDDHNPITPSQLAESLLELKQKDASKFSTYGVLALDKCPMDPDGPPKRIREFLADTNGNTYNLCDDKFGDQLANAGHVIQQKASQIVINLSAEPDQGSIVVTFNGHVIPNDRNGGWIYDEKMKQITLSGDANLTGPAGTQLKVTYTKKNPLLQAGS